MPTLHLILIGLVSTYHGDCHAVIALELARLRNQLLRLQPELNTMSKQGRWQEMGGLIDDQVLHTIAACGTPAEIAEHIRKRVAGVADTVCLYQPGPIPVDVLAAIVDEL